jgi:hypothetical protein
LHIVFLYGEVPQPVLRQTMGGDAVKRSRLLIGSPVNRRRRPPPKGLGSPDAYRLLQNARRERVRPVAG